MADRPHAPQYTTIHLRAGAQRCADLVARWCAGVIEWRQKSSGGGGEDEPLLSIDAQRAAHLNSSNLIPTDWSPDGRRIIFTLLQARYNLWLLPLADNAKPVSFFSSLSDQMHGNFSPDGRLVAYSSNES